KAFHTMGHQHFLVGLVQRGVDPHVIHLVNEMHRNISTYISTEKERTDPIYIRSGVKQGDPMSPLLFNLVVDFLLCELETEGKGFQQGGLRITAMAFADDSVLLSDSWGGMRCNIKILETFCELMNLWMQGEK
ncbi:PO21 protein, partial [Bombycilla garrulus]|nr:PO21 protein [Bombycilla garrulus]